MTEYLAEQLLEKDKLVTYQMVMRHCKLPASQARELIASMYTNHPDKFNAHYVVAGIRNGTKSFVFASHGQLDSSKSTFETVSSIDIYSLHSTGTYSANDICSIDIAVSQQQPKSAELIAIKGPEVCRQVALAPVTKPRPAKPTETKRETKRETKKETKQENSQETKNGNKPKLTYTSRKRQGEPVKNVTNAQRPKLVYQSRKQEAKQPKERVIVADEIDEEQDEQDVKTRSKQMEDLKSMFEDDDSFMAEAAANDDSIEIQGDEPEQDLPHSSMQEEVQDEEVQEEVEQTQQANEEAEEEPEPVQTVDEDGYIVRTQQVKKPVPRATTKVTKPKPAAKTKAKPDKAKKKQMDVASFFSR